MPDEVETIDTEDEECPVCVLSTGLGMYLNVCKQISTDGGKECDELLDKLTKEEITAEDVFKIVKEKVKDKPDQKDILEYIDTLMKGKTDEKAE